MTSNDIEMERTIESEVEVATDPDTAFMAFTDELDLWWVRGPINHHASGRVLAMRCEPDVGGRLLEHGTHRFGDETGDTRRGAGLAPAQPGVNGGSGLSVEAQKRVQGISLLIGTVHPLTAAGAAEHVGGVEVKRHLLHARGDIRVALGDSHGLAQPADVTNRKRRSHAPAV